MDVKKKAGIDLLKKKTPDLQNNLGQNDPKPGYGGNTGGSITAALIRPNPAMTASGTAATKATDSGSGGYQQGDAFRQAQEMLQQQMNNKPGEYRSVWQRQLDDTIQKILNREPFQYDLNGDALYQQYKDRYMLQGQQAMMDTMGQAQAMTGGYGNSYAQSVGQQAYHGYLQQLNDKVPELYQLALDKYRMEGDALQDQYSILARQEDLDYGRYRDQIGDWQAERDYLTGRYDSERNFDYGKYIDERNYEYGKYIDDRNYQYQQERDSRADEQWEREFEEAKRRYDQEWEKKYGTTSTGGTAGGNGSAGGGYDTHGYTKEQIKDIQNAAGIPADGIWGPQTEKAYQDGYMPDSGNPTGGGEPIGEINADTVAEELNEMIHNGAPKSTIAAQLRDYLNAGYITQEEYKNLKEIYAGRGNTY